MGSFEASAQSAASVRALLQKVLHTSAIVSAAGLAWTGQALAQTSPSPATDLAPNEEASATLAAETTAAAGDAGEIVVTGSRLGRAGFNAPTPTTVIDVQQIQAAAPANLADYVNQLPALVGSITPRIANTGASATVGANLLNLRSLGANRTLVLLDGHRVAPSTLTGNIDTSLLPQALIERVDIVTGGASAAWGSDAVAGVVNHVLNRKFEGVLANVQAGITEEGDGETFKAELAYGTPFAGGRGRLIFSAEYHDDQGADAVTSREWFKSRKVIQNPAFTPTNGQPRRITATDVGSSVATSGGLITGPATVRVNGQTIANPLLNTQFGPGGTTRPFNPGQVSGVAAVGGDSEDISQAIQLAVPVELGNLYSRLSFDVTPDVNLFAELGWGKARSDIVARVYERGGNITINRDNAFLPADIRNQMAALGLSTISVGRLFLDWGPLRGRNKREQIRGVIGAEGSFGKGWSWDAYYQRGETDFSTGAYTQNPIIANFNRAVDAVVNPATGTIVCRSTLTNPTNGCVPLNIFGSGSTSAEGRAYVMGNSVQDIEISQDVAAASLRGEPFSLWAGPVSIAAGAEYRREKYASTADALSLTNAFFVGNYKPSAGKFNVKEAFFETLVPLLEGRPLAESLDLNAAVRLTDYSTSGNVTTWKVGLTHDVNDQLRFRGVISRDIRAPNLNELFQGGQTLNQTVNDPVTGTTYSSRTNTTGNLDLEPETADTKSLGVVYRPSWLRGFSASVDYFDIEIEGAIFTQTAQTVIDKCRAGVTFQCAFITRNAGTGLIDEVRLLPLNINSETTKGLDLEFSYRTSLGEADVTLRAVGTHVIDRTETSDGITIEYAGTNANESQPSRAVPDWRWMGTATYERGLFRTTFTGRYIGDGKLNNEWGPLDIDDNHVPAVFYADLSLAYRFERIGDGAEIYFAVQNLFDQDPPAAPNYSTASTIQTGTNGYLYDLLGRQYRAGIRVRF